MNTDTDGVRASHDPENAESPGNEDREWSSDEAGAAQEELMAEGFASSGDEAAPVDPLPDAFDEPTQNTYIPTGGQLPASDPVLEMDPVHETDSGLTPSADPQGSSELGGVAKPEDLGGRDIGAGGDRLVAAEAQEEFLSRWTRIQISFLEDPPTAVESAETLIQDISAAIRTSLDERSSELAAGGQAAADTEQMRLALRQYRAFIGVILPK